MESQLSFLELKKCSLLSPCRCGNTQGHIYPSGNRYHAGKICCSQCDRFLKWVSKKEYERAMRSNLVNDYSDKKL
ncbi:hypothetical protein GM3709_3876 (plasmid) [Geminocystis sp. NIES-3709]|nr:hypothetical protein GM3709_3876 [Geminocystis sp. NIES-3709]